MYVLKKRSLAALMLALLATATLGNALWQSLPPTPPLPPGTVGRTLEVHGARLWYAEWNAQASGVPVLLLHGGYANSAYFGHLIPVLVARGARVIALDSRGHGRSRRTNAPYSYHQMAEDVVALLDALGVARVNIVGWSDGGIIGFDLAVHHPDRVARLFAFGANADQSGLNADFDKTPAFSAYLKRVQEEYRAISPTPSAWSDFDAAMNAMWSTQPAFTATELRAITVPTTIADGEHDEAIRLEHDRYLAATIPGARLVILPGVSHFAMLQDPARFNRAVLDFLK